MRRLERSLLVVVLALLASGCGKKGPLIYPDMLVPAAPAAVTAQQSGSSVKLKFVIPDKDRAGRAVHGVTGVKINRRTTENDQKDVCRSCMTDYVLFQTFYLEHLLPTAQRFGNSLVVLDSEVTTGKSYSYSIVPFTADGVDGASSAIVAVTVAPPMPAPLLKSDSFPTEVKIHISLLNSRPAGRLLGYNLYRATGGAVRSYQPLNSEPLKGGEYVDVALERGVKYRYWARAVMELKSGDVVESSESDEVEGMLKDDE